MAPRRIYWLCQIIGWLAGAAANLLVTLLGDPGAARWRVVATFAAISILAIGWTHGYRFAIRRWQWLQLAPVRLLPRAAAASIVLGAAITASSALLWWTILGDIGNPVDWAPFAVIGWSADVAVWSAVYFGVHHVARMRQLELAQLQLAVVAKDAQLHRLMTQLQPHFLFNCLNSVRGLIVEDPAKAQATVTELSSLMRYALRATTDATVPLATELDMVRTYLGLEAVRFEERLRTQIDLGDGTDGLRVPAMLIQSLVENGVKHGIEHTPAGGTIHVRVWCEDGALRIRVGNPGRLGASLRSSTQIGLANARERLRLIYGAAASLALRDDARGVTAEVSIPLAAEPAPRLAPVTVAGARVA